MKSTIKKFKELFTKENINLLWELTISSFKLRNEGSILGILWYLLNPALMLAVLYIIFSHNIGKGIENYGLFILIGIIQWNFFHASTSEGMNSITKYKELVKKVNFPRELLVISAVLNISISHMIEWIILIIILVITGFVQSLFVLPMIILMQLLISIAVSLILAALFSYYRDIQNIWKNILFIGWFLTPVFYLKNMIPESFSFINIINPMTHVITITRSILLENKFPEAGYLALFIGILLLAVIFAYILFARLIINVAERI